MAPSPSAPAKGRSDPAWARSHTEAERRSRLSAPRAARLGTAFKDQQWEGSRSPACRARQRGPGRQSEGIGQGEALAHLEGRCRHCGTRPCGWQQDSAWQGCQAVLLAAPLQLCLPVCNQQNDLLSVLIFLCWFSLESGWF